MAGQTDAPGNVTINLGPQGRQQTRAQREADPRSPNYPPMPTGAPGGAGGQRFQQLIRTLDNAQVGDVNDLFEFYEGMRKLAHTLAVTSHMIGGQIEAGLKAQAKKDARFHVPGFSVRSSIRRWRRSHNKMGDSLADAAAGAVGGWTTFSGEFAAVLQSAPPARQRPRGFHIPNS